MNTQDTFEVTILEDGTLRVEVAGKVSAANHINAENFMREAAKLAGGPVKITQRAHSHAHGHHHHEGESAHQH